MTANVQHNVVPNQMAYGNNMQNGGMRMQQNVMYQQPMQQPVMHSMGQPVVVQAQQFQPQQPYGNNQVPIMMNQEHLSLSKRFRPAKACKKTHSKKIAGS